MPDMQTIITGFLFILNIVIGVTMWLLKSAYQDLKEQNKENRVNIEKAFKKEDFRDFKEELWHRLDELKQDFNQRVQEVKNG